MNTGFCFRLLLKHELAFGRHGSAAGRCLLNLMVALILGGLPLRLLFGPGLGGGNLEILFQSGILTIFAFLYFISLTVYLSLLIPAVTESLLHGMESQAKIDSGAFEFFFTRAVNRRKVMRAKTAAIFIFTVLPLFVSLGAAFFYPAPRLGSRLLAGGAVVYSWWLLWGAAWIFFLLQGYIVWIAKWVRGGNLWTLLFPSVPAGLAVTVFLAGKHWMIFSPEDFFQRSFAFFAQAPVIQTLFVLILAWGLQTWSERRFAGLEIL